MDNRNRVLTAILIAAIVGMGAGYALGVNPNASYNGVIQPGTLVADAAFVLFTDGTNYFARNGKTGAIDYSSATFSTVLSNANNALDGIGGLIFIKSGTYTDTATVILKSGVSVRGEGQGSTILNAGSSSMSLGFFEIYNDKNNVSVSYLTLDAKKASYSGNRAFYIRIAQDILIDHVTMKDFDSATPAIHIYQTVGETVPSARVSITNNLFLRNDYSPIMANPANPVRGLTVSGNTFYGGLGANPSGAIVFSGVENLRFTNNLIYGMSAQGTNTGLVDLNGVSYATVSDNIVDGSAATNAIAAGITVANSDGVTVSGNVLKNAVTGLDNGAINVWPGPNMQVAVTGNVISFTQNPANHVDGIVIQQDNKAVTVSGNSIYGENFPNVWVGIYAHGYNPSRQLRGTAIVGNSVLNTTFGIVVTFANGTMVSGNYVRSSNYAAEVGSSDYTSFIGNVFESSTTCVYDGTSGRFSIVEHNDVRLCGGSVVSMTGTTPIVRYNIGYATENGGSVSLSTNTTYTFLHHLVATPVLVLLSVSNNACGAIGWTATSSAITVTAASGCTATVYWKAQMWTG